MAMWSRIGAPFSELSTRPRKPCDRLTSFVKSQQMHDTFSSYLKSSVRGEQHDKTRTSESHVRRFIAGRSATTNTEKLALPTGRERRITRHEPHALRSSARSCTCGRTITSGPTESPLTCSAFTRSRSLARPYIGSWSEMAWAGYRRIRSTSRTVSAGNVMRKPSPGTACRWT